jgi:hypothetical protein
MIWQDIALSIIPIFFCFGLLVAIHEGRTINPWMSSIYGICLIIQAYVFFTLELYISVNITLFNGLMWLYAWVKL